MPALSQARWAVRAVLVLALFLPTAVRAADGTRLSTEGDWALLRFDSQNVDPDSVETFRALLQSELSVRAGVALVRLPDVCGDHRCAAAAAVAAGCDVAVFGSLGTLGQKIVVSATALLADSGELLNSVRFTVDREEDLDAAAVRVARAIVEGRSTDETATLGSITAQEQAPDLRRHGDSGFALRVGGVVPFGRGFSEGSFGLQFDAAYWYEAREFSIEPRIGVRFSSESEGRHRYVQVPIDVGAHYILGLGDVAPFFGGGLGARWIWSRMPKTFLVGSALTTRHEQEVADSKWGFGMFARVGVLFFRTYSVRLALTVDYDVTFATLHGGDFPMLIAIGLSVVF